MTDKNNFWEAGVSELKERTSLSESSEHILIISLNDRARECAKNILPRISNCDVEGTSAIERQSNVHSYKRGMFDHCFDSVFISSLEKLWCSLRASALVFSIVFYNRIMATCSPSQERQLVLMESMNRRLDSFLASQKKLEEKNATLQQENVKLRSELSKQERLNNTKRRVKEKCQRIKKGKNEEHKQRCKMSGRLTSVSIRKFFFAKSLNMVKYKNLF